MKWRIAILGLLVTAAGWVWLHALDNGPLTAARIASLEPNLCSNSPWTIMITSIVPILPGSPTQSMEFEQVALIDQYKGTGWRKVWVLRMPAAYITHRTCDSGRQNWVGQGGDDLRVSQHYELSLVLMDEDIVPTTHAIKGKHEAGLPVVVSLTNRVNDPAKRHRGYAKQSFVNGFFNDKRPPKCREEPSEIPGLVTFTRIDLEQRSGIYCGGFPREGAFASKVYGRKIGELTYEFVVHCVVNCRLYSDYQGWGVELVFPRTHLERWSFMQDRIGQFLDRYTMHIEHDDPNARR